mmetsp:Transcript_29890/g.68582  ORF Transcript_29890/g.68582 Transcript_29890/m.68582 type:complete len:533 (-) Transcript_29890:257-1855(-)
MSDQQEQQKITKPLRLQFCMHRRSDGKYDVNGRGEVVEIDDEDDLDLVDANGPVVENGFFRVLGKGTVVSTSPQFLAIELRIWKKGNAVGVAVGGKEHRFHDKGTSRRKAFDNQSVIEGNDEVESEDNDSDSDDEEQAPNIVWFDKEEREEDEPVHPDPPAKLPPDEQNEVEEEGLDESMDFCLICREVGDLMCCRDCPRAFHPGCLNNDDLGEEGEDDWVCHVCREDNHILPRDFVNGRDYYELVESKYKEHWVKSQEDRYKFITILSRIWEIVDWMIHKSDFGEDFRDPVSAPGYTDVIKKPMDLGTISESFSSVYPEVHKGALKKRRGASGINRLCEFKSSLFYTIGKILTDIQLVWNNCRRFNISTFDGKKSAIYRKADIMEKIFNKMFAYSVLKDSMLTYEERDALGDANAVKCCRVKENFEKELKEGDRVLINRRGCRSQGPSPKAKVSPEKQRRSLSSGRKQKRPKKLGDYECEIPKDEGPVNKDGASFLPGNQLFRNLLDAGSSGDEENSGSEKGDLDDHKLHI